MKSRHYRLILNENISLAAFYLNILFYKTVRIFQIFHRNLSIFLWVLFFTSLNTTVNHTTPKFCYDYSLLKFCFVPWTVGPRRIIFVVLVFCHDDIKELPFDLKWKHFLGCFISEHSYAKRICQSSIYWYPNESKITVMLLLCVSGQSYYNFSP